MADVGKFFDAQATAYFATPKGPMAPYHLMTAEKLEDGLAGKVAAIGGIWAQANLDRCRMLDLTVVDVSANMLGRWAAAGFRTILGDARTMPFEAQSIDHVVLPLILHHIAGNSWSEARTQVGAVVDEAHRILKPGGTLWISDFSVNPLIYAAERVASPLTKRLLGTLGIPLVIMHPESFFRRQLSRAGFGSLTTFKPKPTSTSSLDLLAPIIGLPWLKVPRGAFPLEAILLTGIKV